MKAGMAQQETMVLQQITADTVGCRVVTTLTKRIHRIIIRITLRNSRARSIKRILDKAHRIKFFRAQTKDRVMAKVPLDRLML